MRRRLAGWMAVAAGGLALLAAPPANAKSYDLPSARVVMTVRPDGSLAVTENITFKFSGSFSGAERSIPVRSFEQLDSVTVSENGRAYQPGASTQTGSSGDPGTFGAVRQGDREHVVWHYSASDETRSFRISYLVRGAALAYDDVVEVNQQVWGGEWPSKLGRLEATLVLPGQADRSTLHGWGHPGLVHGSVVLDADRIVLNASNLSSRRAVELHTTFPRGLLTSTAGTRTHPGLGMDAVLASERQLSRDEAPRPLTAPAALIAAAMGIALGLLLLLAVYLRFGRDRPDPTGRAGPPAPLVSVPPDDLPPALVPSLLREDHMVGNRELTATILDLIRRGVVVTERVAGRSKDGARGDGVGDLRVIKIHSDREHLVAFEATALHLLKGPLKDGGPFKLSELPSLLARNRPRSRAARENFLLQVSRAVERRNWYERSRRRVLGKLRWLALLSMPAAPALSYWRIGTGPLPLLIGALAFWLTLELGGTRRGLTTRRTPQAATEARRWKAYRGNLERLGAVGDDPALEGSQAWDQLLTYAVALGLSDEVLRVAATRASVRQPAIGPLRTLHQGLASSISSTNPMLSDSAWDGLGPVPGAHTGRAWYGGRAGGGFPGGHGVGGAGGVGGVGGAGGAGGGGGGGAW